MLLPDYLTTGTEAVAGVEPLSVPVVLSLLGYREYQANPAFIASVRTNLGSWEISRADEIRTELSEIDTKIKEILAESAVIKTCKTELNWPAQLRMYKQQGHELLKELARIYDVELVYSKYSSGRRNNYVVQYQ